MPALRAGKRAKCWAAFSGHGVKIWVGTDKSSFRDVLVPFTLEVFHASVVFKIENLDFESAFADSNTDLFSFIDGIFELEFVFTLRNTSKNDSTHEKTSRSSSGVFHRWQVFL